MPFAPDLFRMYRRQLGNNGSSPGKRHNRPCWYYEELGSQCLHQIEFQLFCALHGLLDLGLHAAIAKIPGHGVDVAATPLIS
jgi:hypothetical protein